MRRLMTLLAATLCLFGPALTPALAQCVGHDLMETLEPAEKAALVAATDAVPYPRGNYWTATRGDSQVTLVGTYHLDDPRHADTMKTLVPLIGQATTVLVEATPAEEKQLVDHMTRNPAILLITDGPSLIDQLPESDWQALSDALSRRGVPSFMAAKMQPWYVNMLLAIPACTMTQKAMGRGLDGLVMAEAQKAGKDLRPLEPYDTVLTLFDMMAADEQLSMIKATLAFEDRAEDFATTLTEAYFDGESRLIWEFMRQQSYELPGFTPAQIDHEFARMEEALMSTRNRNWIPVIEDAAARGPVVAAFGALHLPGQDGVLALLERAGYAIAPLTLQ